MKNTTDFIKPRSMKPNEFYDIILPNGKAFLAKYQGRKYTRNTPDGYRFQLSDNYSDSTSFYNGYLNQSNCLIKKSNNQQF